jgi:hypothetical protein
VLNFIVEKVFSNKRRVAVVETLDLRVLQDNLKFHISFIQKEGKKHFSQSMVMSRMIDDIGWPVKSDAKSMDLFKQLFTREVSRYQPSLKGRNCYSFQLKSAPNHHIQSKVLRG